MKNQWRKIEFDLLGRYTLITNLLLVFSLAVLSAEESPVVDYFSRCHEASFDMPEYRPLLNVLGELVLGGGGARVIRIKGQEYVFAVGMTDVRSSSPREQMRRITVARAKAVKELVRMIEKTHVAVKEEAKTETVVVTNVDGSQAAVVEEHLLDEYRERVNSIIKVPKVAATWLSEDKSLFFVAIGGALR